MTRTERQKEGIKKWVNANCCGTCVYCTGFGKTHTAIMAIRLLLKTNPNASILISVPTEVLKNQWMAHLLDYNLTNNCQVNIINSIIKHKWNVDLLIIDETHIVASDCFREIFNVVNYSFILCLTGTLERLDGKEILIKKLCPVIDTVTLEEATKNKWISPVKEYVVLIDTDLTKYNEINKKFNSCFAYFDWDFNLALKCTTDFKTRQAYARTLNTTVKEVTGVSMSWMKALKARKSFIQDHPKKREIARKILNARKDKKCITFSATIKASELLSEKNEFVLHSKQSKKMNSEIMDTFNNLQTGVLHTNKAADVGVDVKGLSVGIILGIDSSKIRKNQRSGRICRFEEGKTAEMFTLVLRGTQEWNWFCNSKTTDCIIITEQQLDDILAGKEIETRQRETKSNIKFRF